MIHFKSKKHLSSLHTNVFGFFRTSCLRWKISRRVPSLCSSACMPQSWLYTRAAQDFTISQPKSKSFTSCRYSFPLPMEHPSFQDHECSTATTTQCLGAFTTIPVICRNLPWHLCYSVLALLLFFQGAGTTAHTNSQLLVWIAAIFALLPSDALFTVSYNWIFI